MTPPLLVLASPRWQAVCRRSDGLALESGLWGPQLVWPCLGAGPVSGLGVQATQLGWPPLAATVAPAGWGGVAAGLRQSLSWPALAATPPSPWSLQPQTLQLALCRLLQSEVPQFSRHTWLGFRPKALFCFSLAGSGHEDDESGRSSGQQAFASFGAAVEAAPAAAHRFWRLQIEAGSADEMRLRRLLLREQPDGPDVAGSGTASASDGQSSAAKAIDASSSSFWSQSANTVGQWPQWLQVDLGSTPRAIREYVLGLGDATTATVSNGYQRYPTRWALEWSDEGSQWTRLGGLAASYTVNQDAAGSLWREDRRLTPLCQAAVAAHWLSGQTTAGVSSSRLGIGFATLSEAISVSSFDASGFSTDRLGASAPLCQPYVLAFGGEAIAHTALGALPAPPRGGQQSITLGFMPRLLLTFGQINDGNAPEPGLSFGMVAADGQWAQACQGRDGAGSLQRSQLVNGRGVLASTGRGGRVRLTAEGFEIDWPTDRDESPQSELFYLALGGAFEARVQTLAVPAAPGPQPLPVPAATQALLLLGGGLAARGQPGDDVSPGQTLGLGVAVDRGIPVVTRRLRLSLYNGLANPDWANQASGHLMLTGLQGWRPDGSRLDGPLRLVGSEGGEIVQAEVPAQGPPLTLWQSEPTSIAGLTVNPARLVVDLGRQEALGYLRWQFSGLSPGSLQLEQEGAEGWQLLVDARSGQSCRTASQSLDFAFCTQTGHSLSRHASAGVRTESWAAPARLLTIGRCTANADQPWLQAAVDLPGRQLHWQTLAAGSAGQTLGLCSLGPLRPQAMDWPVLAPLWPPADWQLVSLRQPLGWPRAGDGQPPADWQLLRWQQTLTLAWPLQSALAVWSLQTCLHWLPVTPAGSLAPWVLQRPLGWPAVGGSLLRPWAALARLDWGVVAPGPALSPWRLLAGCHWQALAASQPVGVQLAQGLGWRAAANPPRLPVWQLQRRPRDLRWPGLSGATSSPAGQLLAGLHWCAPATAGVGVWQCRPSMHWPAQVASATAGWILQPQLDWSALDADAGLTGWSMQRGLHWRPPAAVVAPGRWRLQGQITLPALADPTPVRIVSLQGGRVVAWSGLDTARPPQLSLRLWPGAVPQRHLRWPSAVACLIVPRETSASLRVTPRPTGMIRCNDPQPGERQCLITMKPLKKSM